MNIQTSYMLVLHKTSLHTTNIIFIVVIISVNQQASLPMI